MNQNDEPNAMNNNKVKQSKLTDRLRSYFQRRRPHHDRLLALNMSIFNFEGGWSRIFNPINQLKP